MSQMTRWVSTHRSATEKRNKRRSACSAALSGTSASPPVKLAALSRSAAPLLLPAAMCCQHLLLSTSSRNIVNQKTTAKSARPMQGLPITQHVRAHLVMSRTREPHPQRLVLARAGGRGRRTPAARTPPTWGFGTRGPPGGPAASVRRRGRQRRAPGGPPAVTRAPQELLPAGPAREDELEANSATDRNTCLFMAYLMAGDRGRKRATG